MNYIETSPLGVPGYDVGFPALAPTSEPVVDVSVARYLPFAEELFVGGFNLVAQAPAANPVYAAESVCEDPTNCLAEDLSLALITRLAIGDPGGGGGNTPVSNLNLTGGLITTYGAASPQLVGRNSFSDNDGIVNGTLIVDRGQFLDVARGLAVQNPLPQLKQLGSIESHGGNIRVGNSAIVQAETNMYLKATALTVGIDSVIAIQKNLVIEPDSRLTIDLSQNFPFNVSFINITVANYSRVSGQFQSVNFIEPVRRAVVSSLNGTTCVGVISQPQTNYGSSTLTVTASVTNQCSETGSGGLSTGAIIGIAVGAAVGGILLAVLIILLSKYLISRNTAAGNKEIRMKELG